MSNSPVQNGILVDLLVYGPDRAGNIGRRIGRPPSSVSRSLGNLVGDGLISDKGDGVYELTGAGRNVARNMVRSDWTPYSSDGNGRTGPEG